MKTKKINDCKVRPIRIPKPEKKDILGSELFGENLYSNIFILARKRNGKTSCINHIFKSTADKNTKVIVFSNTCLQDKTWLEIKKYMTR